MHSQYGLRHAKRIDNLTAKEVTTNDKAIQAAPTALRGLGHWISCLSGYSINIVIPAMDRATRINIATSAIGRIRFQGNGIGGGTVLSHLTASTTPLAKRAAGRICA